MIKLNFFSKTNNWSRRIAKVKKVSKLAMKEKSQMRFKKNIIYYLNIILTNDAEIKKLNLKYKKNNKTTDVLTFISEYKNDKKLTKYCDIYFSANMIENDSKKNKIDFYDHFENQFVPINKTSFPSFYYKIIFARRDDESKKYRGEFIFKAENPEHNNSLFSENLKKILSKKIKTLVEKTFVK